MILLVVVAFILIAGVTILQYKQQAEEYHNDRLQHKEDQVIASINYTLENTTWPPTTDNLQYIFRDEIYRISDIQNVPFNIYDLDGNLIKSSKPYIEEDSTALQLNDTILNAIAMSPYKRYVEKHIVAGDRFRASYSYITDMRFKPIGILNIPYFENDSFNNRELRSFLLRLGGVYVFILIVAIFLAYIISKYITRSLKTVSNKMQKTKFSSGAANKRIVLEHASEEIYNLVNAYNGMVDALEESAIKLARSEREQAWREMARQVAHEIKNPLTPMRLSVQSFQKKFDPSDPDMEKKLNEFSRTLIQQIDTMSSIASAFSNFASMPAQQNETLNVVKIVRLALDIFTEDYISFITHEDKIIARLDRTQLIRVITNLVKNAIQSIPEGKEPKVVVSVFSEGQKVKITVADNGCGIADENRDKIFEPKFTTKTSGMGLGLGMVKNIVENYKGSINFTSLPGKGTVFTIVFPKE
ncbi:sensor histidine kinase [Sinomicrobium weinanense]|uniref:histidine kinase n=1 Tax=Sinomicrobium weinanense TaxID=2842200 RepID=A0A926JNV8_9FLAO|nr:ATP-binding protein [Sinomicrobium weinanense]MBC9794609.1 GHKL domain-containing protein [Sinomicrobium weinanense]MBU3124094.1 GHKL domain-containing protein [Sinomicrobium weinanense]